MNTHANMTPEQAMTEAAQLQGNGSLGEAEALYRQILAAAPAYHPAYHALALLAHQGGKLAIAAELVAQAIALDDSIALYHRNLCEMYRRMGRLDEAIAEGRCAVMLEAEDLDAHYNLALALANAGDTVQALVHYQQAVAINPQHGLSWNNLGAAQEKLGDKPAAEKSYARAVAINPQHAEAQNNLGALYSEQARLDEACACFEAAIEEQPHFIDPHFNLCSLKKYNTDDPHFKALEALAANPPSLSPDANIRLQFALGKAREDAQHYTDAFSAYARGNSQQHATLPYDEEQADSMARRVQETFSQDFFAQQTRNDEVSNKTPIFIVGMPRSGTTLIEQVLDSHASLFGAGELSELNEVIHAAIEEDNFPEAVSKLGKNDFHKMAATYIEKVWALVPEANYISDKMPANFFYIGLIHLLFPNAKIIHAMRDPMDSCLSCYSRHFKHGMEFAYDLGTLGRYNVRYRQLMDHWHKVLPKGTVLDVYYEDMVDDIEAQARRLLDYIGLPWDANCLKFYDNTRRVQTASVAQVRKPIYKTSVARWKHFEEQLTPLLEIVKDYR